MQTRIAIWDREIGAGLSAYMLQHPSGLQPVLCGSWEELCEADAPLALVADTCWEETQVRQAEEKGMLLLRLGAAGLSPYQPADCLIREIYRQAMERECPLAGSSRMLYDKTEVVAVCSPHGYDQQSAFAVIYSLLHAEKKRTLYMDFTYYSGFFETSGEDVGDLFYELHKHCRPISAVLAAMAQRFGQLDYIPPVRTQMDLEDVTEKELTELLERILQEGGYELIVLNLPVRPGLLRAAYDCCSSMYSLQREGILYDRAQTRLLDDLGQRSEQPSSADAPTEKLRRLRVVRMPPVSGSFSMDETMYEQLMFGEMAAFIRKLDRLSEDGR